MPGAKSVVIYLKGFFYLEKISVITVSEQTCGKVYSIEEGERSNEKNVNIGREKIPKANIYTYYTSYPSQPFDNCSVPKKKIIGIVLSRALWAKSTTRQPLLDHKICKPCKLLSKKVCKCSIVSWQAVL